MVIILYFNLAEHHNHVNKSTSIGSFFRGAARYPAKFMVESSFYDNLIISLFFIKRQLISHKLLHSFINFAGCLVAPMLFVLFSTLLTLYFYAKLRACNIQYTIYQYINSVHNIGHQNITMLQWSAALRISLNISLVSFSLQLFSRASEIFNSTANDVFDKFMVVIESITDQLITKRMSYTLGKGVMIIKTFLRIDSEIFFIST